MTEGQALRLAAAAGRPGHAGGQTSDDGVET